MAQVIQIKHGDLIKAELLWSEKYACPVYKVKDRFYIEETGEYAGYFDECIVEVFTPPTKDTKEKE